MNSTDSKQTSDAHLASHRLAVLEAALAYRAPPIRPSDFRVPERPYLFGAGFGVSPWVAQAVRS